MRNGTIFLQKPNWELGKSLTDRVIKVIQFITQSRYYHVVLYLNGWYWESTVWFEGKKMLHGMKRSKSLWHYDTALEPVQDLTDNEVKIMELHLMRELKKKRPYNVLKLIALIIVYPTRWIWRALGWVPFSNNVFGYVCSVFVDEAYMHIQRDILPDDYHEYTAPVDLLRTIEANTFRQA